MDNETPAQKSLALALETYKKPRGIRRAAWMKVVQDDRGRIGITSKIGTPELRDMTQNRRVWREIVQNQEAQSHPMGLA